MPKGRASMNRNIQLSVSASPPMHAISSPATLTPPLESTSTAPDGINDTYWVSDSGRIGQLLDSESLSTIGDSPDDDLMTPMESSWALDQYNNLYDFSNEYYPGMHDTPLYHSQDTFIHFPGYAPLDMQTNPLAGEKVETSLQRNLEN